MSRLVFGVVGTLLLAWTVLVGSDSWVNAHRLAEGPENESSLYQSYDPEQVIKRFRYERESYGGLHSCGASHLVKSIHHSQGFTPKFTMQANREGELLNALREDIMLRLRMPGMTVTVINNEADGGFTYKYTTENGGGSISVQAPVHQMTVRRYPVPSDVDDVELTIAMEEAWTRPGSETRWWMAAVN
jgi:hypothetical protein